MSLRNQFIRKIQPSLSGLPRAYKRLTTALISSYLFHPAFRGAHNLSRFFIGILILFTLLLASCAKAKLTPDEYKHFMQTDKEMVKTKVIGPYSYKLESVPAEWIAYTNLYPKSNTGDYGKKLEEAGGMYYFRLTLDIKDGKQNVLKYDLHKESEYFERLYYVSYLMKDDIKMIVDDKEYPCLLYSYERTYDLNSRLSFLMGFAKPANADDVTVEITPAGLNNDRIKMKFDASVFQSFPKLLL